MRSRSRRILFGALLVLAAATNYIGRVHADGECCAHCGRGDGCQKVCRLVREDKKITTVCWGCKSEDFCVPGPSTLGGVNCEMVCVDNTDPKAPCVEPKKLTWKEWIPGGCAKVYTKKKLMKRTITKSVPSFKWVVEDLCADCEANTNAPNIPPGTQVPPVPPVGADVIVVTPAAPKAEEPPAPVKKQM